MFAAVFLLFRDRAVAVLLGTLFFGCLGQAVLYLQLGIEDFYVFLIPAFLAFGLCISAGLGAALRWAEGLGGGPAVGVVVVFVLSLLMLAIPLVGLRATYVEHDRSGDFGGRKTIETVACNVKQNATVLHHRSPLWYMVLVEQRRRDLTLIDPFCTSWDRHTDVVWPDDISASEAAERYGTGDTTGVEAARLAAENGPVYLLANARSSLGSFREAGFHVVPVGKGGELYRLVPGDR
jgi:hypothetical protein